MKTFFYNDESGKLKKYLYCSRGCPEPYKQSDIGLSLFKANQNTFICKKCVSILGMKCDLLKTEHKVRTEEEFIDIPVIELKSEFELKITEQQQAVVSEVTSEQCVQHTIETKSDYVAYALRCKDNTFYCGVTTNLENAVKYHNSGSGSPFTKPKEKRPVIVIETKPASSQEEAKKNKEELRKKYMLVQ